MPMNAFIDMYSISFMDKSKLVMLKLLNVKSVRLGMFLLLTWNVKYALLDE
jgi:hypothetical protein